MDSGWRQTRAGYAARTDGTRVSPAPDPGREARSGDNRLEVEVSEAYLAHAHTVRRHAARAALGDYQAAEDATQEAFMAAVRDWPRFRQLPSAHQRTWLCGRARWRVIDGWRATSGEYPVDALPDQPDPQACEDTLLADIATERFWRVITTVVPRRAARAAYLRWHEGWTMTGIARYLGIDRATALRDLNKVLEAARQEVTRQMRDEIGFPATSKGGKA